LGCRPGRRACRSSPARPRWAALASEIGGDKVSVYAATTGARTPTDQARHLISRLHADLTVCTGAELEIGWLPMIVTQSANKKIVPGSRGVFQPTDFVNLLEKPASLDRSQGDIHAGGNPHIQGDPRNMLPVGKALADRFAQLDPPNAATYHARYAAFATK
jgi:zinc/manganese transport system substrate-binding protein